MAQTSNIVFPVYEGVTQLDFTGPHQFLSRAPDLDVQVASLGAASISTDGLTFSDLDDLTATATCDVLLLPGGGGCIAAIENELFMQQIVRPGATVDDDRIVRDGYILTGGGVTAGIDFALTGIADLRGQQVAGMVQLRLQYAPQPPFNADHPETAAAEILEAVNSRIGPSRVQCRARLEALAATHHVRGH